MILYLDTSALAKRYVSEPGSSRIRGMFRRHAPIAVSRIAHAELAATLARAAREGRLSDEVRDRHLARIEADFAELTVVEVRAALARAVPDLVRRHPLRGYDAVHLASALALRLRGIAVTFWCADARLADAARAEGLRAGLVG